MDDESTHRTEKQLKAKIAATRAKTTLKVGDRLRVIGCPGTKRWVTFSGWDGDWLLTKSGRCNQDYHPVNIDKVNDREIDFTINIQQTEQ